MYRFAKRVRCAYIFFIEIIEIIEIVSGEAHCIFLAICALWKLATISIISIISIKKMHAHRYKCSNSDCTITTKSVMQTTNLTKKTKGCFAIWMNLITRWLIICSFKFDKFVVRKTAGLVYAQTTNLTKKTNYVVIFLCFRRT